MSHLQKLTFKDWALLQSGAYARIYHELARVECRGSGEDKRFFLVGPSGEHSLLCSETDMNRLNAHWIPFCLNEANRYPPKMAYPDGDGEFAS